MVVARTLTPHELGIFAIAIAITILSSEVRLIGVGDYLVREKDLSSDTVRSGLGLTIVISWSLGLLLLILAPYMAMYYEQPDIEILLYILAPGFFLSPFISVNSSLLAKDFQFGRSVSIQWAGQITNFSLALILLINGFSYYALAIGVTVGLVVELLFTRILQSQQMCWLFSLRGFKPIFSFGSINSLANLTNKLSTLSYDLIIGKLGTSADVAIFSRAAGFPSFLAHLLIAGANPVALPYFSENNTDKKTLKSAYLRSTALAGAISLPPLLAIGALGEPVILVMFGDQWGASIELIPYLSLWLFFTYIHPFKRQLLLTIKCEKVYLSLQTIIAFLICLAVYFGYPNSLESIAMLFSLIGFVDFLLTTMVIRRYAGISVGSFIRVVWKNIALSIFCLTTAYFIAYSFTFMDIVSPLLQLVIAGGGLAVVWVFLLFLLKHPLLKEIGRRSAGSV